MARTNIHAGPPTYRRMKQVLRETERASHTGGTGATILKLERNPIGRLVDDGKIGPLEFQAAQDIETAFFALSGGMMFKPLSMEKIDRAARPEWPERVAEAVTRYQRWAGHWSMLRAQCDHTLPVVIQAVVDQRQLRTIAEDLGFGLKRIQHAVIRGLRDYAARAEWVDSKLSAQWKCEAGMTFKRVAQ